MKKKYIIVIVIVILLVLLVMFVANNKLHTTKQIEKEVSKYSFNYSLIKTDEATLGVEGWMEHQKDWYFHDNDFDFDFYATSQITEIGKSKHYFVGYWEPYINKATEVLRNDFERCIKEEFSEVYNISKIDFEYSNDVYAWRIHIHGDKTEKYSRDNWKTLVKDASRKICNVLEEYDSNFRNRKLNGGWFKLDKDFYFQWYGDNTPNTFYYLSTDDIS